MVAVLQDNLHGLEIDGCCVQIACFAVALTAWKIGGFQRLPLPHVAWVGAPPPLRKTEFVALAAGDADLERGLAALHDLFTRAPVLGSLLEPAAHEAIDPLRVARAGQLIERLIAKVRKAEPEQVEGVIAARGLADAASLLCRRFTLQATNVPFLGRGKQGETLAHYLDQQFGDAKADLGTAMLERMHRSADEGSTVAAVTPQNWLFLAGYRKFRERLLSKRSWHFAARLGAQAFEAISGEVVQVALTISGHESPAPTTFAGIDAAAKPGEPELPPREKADRLAGRSGNDGSETRPPLLLSVASILANPNRSFSFVDAEPSGLLSDIAQSYVGIQSGDAPRWIQRFWEQAEFRDYWQLFQIAPTRRRPIDGCTSIIRWGDEQILRGEAGARVQGLEAFGRRGVIVQRMADLTGALYLGGLFDTNTAAVVPKDSTDLSSVIATCWADDYATMVRDRAPGLSITNQALANVPLPKERNQSLPNGHSRSSDNIDGFLHSVDPTQWLFHGHPAKADQATAIHVALARLCGYRWPAETDAKISLSNEARDWVARAAALPGGDRDGLVAIPALAGQRALAERLRADLVCAFGSNWSDALERKLIAGADAAFDGKVHRDASIDAWIRDRAFAQHCTLFQNRPFLWHVWDGLKDGFSAFLHYHRLDRAVLEKLTFRLLGEWIARQRAAGDDRREEAALILQQALEKIIEGEAPYDIFVRWKPLSKLPIGWEPDIDDGVRLNIRPFMEAKVLRVNPNIKWGKDRGSDAPSAPWYEEFKGERINDRHTTLAAKRDARRAQ